jgi:hypothetical protein
MENTPLTKREIIATSAMAAMIGDHTHALSIIPELAVQMADALIEELNKAETGKDENSEG